MPREKPIEYRDVPRIKSIFAELNELKVVPIAPAESKDVVAEAEEVGLFLTLPLTPQEPDVTATIDARLIPCANQKNAEATAYDFYVAGARKVRVGGGVFASLNGKDVSVYLVTSINLLRETNEVRIEG